MSHKLVLTFVLCSIWLEAASPQGTDLFKCRFAQGKSCETKQTDTSQNTHEQRQNLLLNNASLNGKQKAGRRTVMSTPDFSTGLTDGKHDFIFVNSLRQQRQQQRLLEKQRQISSATRERLQPDNHEHRLGSQTAVATVHQREGSEANNREQWLQGQHDLALSAQKRKSVHYNRSNEEITELRTHTNNYDKLETYAANTRNSHLIQHTKSNPNPNVKRLGYAHNTELSHFSNHKEKVYGQLLTESTTIHPFIAPRQALDYLTSYDSKRRPRRWPLWLLLQEREHTTLRENRADGSGTEDVIGGHMHDTWGHRRKNRYTRSTFNTVRQVSENGTHTGVKDPREARVKVKDKLAYENKNDGEFEEGSVKYAENTGSNHRQKNIFHVANEKSRDVEWSHNTSAPISTEVETASRGGWKYKNRVRQQQQKRKKKSKKRKKQRTSETNLKTNISANGIPEKSTVDSVHDPLTRADLQTPQNEHIAKNTSNEPNTTTELNMPQLLKGDGVSVVKFVSSSTDSAQILEACLFNLSCQLDVMSDTPGHGQLDTDTRTPVGITSQPTRKQRQLRANRNKSQNNKSKLKRKSNNSKVSTQTENITDNHMFVSRNADFIATTFFTPINSKTVPDGIRVKALLENYVQESSDVSSTSRRQIASDRSFPAHVSAPTDSGLHQEQVMAGSPAWPLTQTPWAITYSKTEEVASRNRGHYSASQEMSHPSSMSTTNKSTTVNGDITTTSSENAENQLRKLSVPTSMLNTNMKLPSVNISQRSPGGFWKNRLKKYHQETRDGENYQKYTNSRNSKYDNQQEEKPTIIGEPYHDSSLDSKKRTIAAEKGNQETPDNGPFIGYKTAYDFLSHQRGPKTHAHNEGRREANELNRFMGEGMCEIFKKHYVPTRIGGKCE